MCIVFAYHRQSDCLKDHLRTTANRLSQTVTTVLPYSSFTYPSFHKFDLKLVLCSTIHVFSHHYTSDLTCYRKSSYVTWHRSHSPMHGMRARMLAVGVEAELVFACAILYLDDSACIFIPV
jgi:hypothetical protein